LASSITPTMIILMAGLSVGLSQITTTSIIFQKTTSIITSKTTIIILLKWITTVPPSEKSPILQPNATPKMTITSGGLAAAMILPSTKEVKIPKITPIIIPTVTTTIVLLLKTTMITIWMATKSVPPLPLPPIATLAMPLLEKIIRIM